MCIICHSNLTDEQVISNLEDILNSNDDKYETWNETSLHRMFIISTGYNGFEAMNLASKIMDKFLIWKKNNKQSGLSDEYVLQVTDYIKKVQDMFMEEGLTTQEVKEKVHQGCFPTGYPDVFIQEDEPVVYKDIEREINVGCLDRLHYSFIRVLNRFSCIRV